MATDGQEPERQAPLRGRQAEAARNDAAILEAARAVFLRDSSAPMSAVAERAGVGVAGLYRRFAGKDELLRKKVLPENVYNGIRERVVARQS